MSAISFYVITIMRECFSKSLIEILHGFPAELFYGLARVRGIADPPAVARASIVASAGA